MSSDQGDFNKGGFQAFIFSMIFTMSFFVYVAFIHKGVDLREVKNVVPNSTQNAEPNAPIGPQKMDLSTVKEPWISTEQLIDHGHAVFNQNCVMCHGPKGLGDGPAGQALKPPPRNFVQGKWTKGGTSLELFHTISTGIPGSSMASFAHLSPADRWTLVHFIRSITQNKVKDDEAALKAKAPTLK